MKFCRVQALIEELLMDWDKLNLAAKLLVYLGFFLVLSTIFIAICDAKDIDLYNRIEVIFRTSLASVFGFILSSNIKRKEDNDKNSYVEKMTISMEREKAITEECKIKKETIKYYYGDGNTVQVVVALSITIIAALVILSIYAFDITKDVAILAQFRDLMCTSIGFLLGEAKIKSKN